MVERFRRRPILAFCAAIAIAATVAMIGCASAPVGGPITIECQVFYRASPSEAFQESATTLGPGNGSHKEEFGDLTFSATFLDDPGEGPALSLVVSDATSQNEITRQLYQINRAQGLHDQFVGGHGFTGLNYVFHPTTSAELQDFCLAK